MKRFLLALSLGCLIAAGNLGSAVPQQVPPGHPDTTGTPPGHPPTNPTTPATPAPTAVGNPAEYPEHLKSVEAIVNAAFETISGPRGQDRDWDKYRELFFPEARMYSARVVHATSIVGGLSVDDFIAAEGKYLRGTGYFEKPLNMRIEKFSNIAHVRSVYEARRNAEDEKPYLRGIYSIQLVYTAGRWWILNMLWQTEDPTNPIPEEFLK